MIEIMLEGPGDERLRTAAATGRDAAEIARLIWEEESRPRPARFEVEADAPDIPERVRVLGPNAFTSWEEAGAAADRAAEVFRRRG
jgi:hypothetical protein